jgi:hypothetical protein
MLLLAGGRSCILMQVLLAIFNRTSPRWMALVTVGSSTKWNQAAVMKQHLFAHTKHTRCRAAPPRSRR